LLAAALALTLAAGAPQAPVPPDHVGVMTDCCDAFFPTVRSHAGRFRRDFPGASLTPRDEVTSQYEAPGQPAFVTVRRNSKGEVVYISVRARSGAGPLDETGWSPTGQSRNVAGETCAVQRKGRRLERCRTEDGVDVVQPPGPDGGPPLQMKTLAREPVDPAEVTPPLDLLDLRRWAPAGALRNGSHRDHRRDYVATFPGQQLTVRRSGGWTQTTRAGEPTVENEALRLAVSASAEGDHISIWRLDPAREFFGPFTPAVMEGRAGETLFGETCRWRSRAYTPDATLFECRTADGALLATGEASPYGSSWRSAASFKRQPVALDSVLPAPELFRPEHYGLTRDGGR